MSGNGIKKLMQLHFLSLDMRAHTRFFFQFQCVWVCVFLRLFECEISFGISALYFVKLNMMQLLLKFIVWLHGSTKW